MHLVQHRGKGRHIIQQRIKVGNRILVCQIQSKFSQHLFMHIPMGNIGDVRIYHQGKQVQYEICAFPQNDERGKAEVFEAGVVHGLCTTHSIYHLFADFDGWCEHFRVTTEDVTEIDVEEMSVRRQ